MLQVYNFIIAIYGVLIYIFSIFNNKAKLFIDGRKNWEETLKNSIKKNEKYIWFHCASLGEFEQGRQLIEKIKNKLPEYKIILTFFSPSGFEIRKDYQYADLVFYLPLDKKNDTEKFIEILNPKIVIFIKYEFWINYINTLNEKKIPLFIISSIFRESQFFFKWYGKWSLKYLKKIKLIFVQNIKSKKILESNNIYSIIAGDTRFDRVLEIKKQNEELNFIKEFKNEEFLIVFGSTWGSDEKLIINFINNNKIRNLKFVIAPHNISEINNKNLTQKLNLKSIRFSQIKNQDLATFDILILDTIGILMKIYKYSNLTYIGGGFERGIHNILEPAVFGNPIVIGPKYEKFQEAISLVQKKGITVIKNQNKFSEVMINLLKNNDLLLEKSKICIDFVEENKNATDIIFKEIEPYLK